jgi:hypothetical protein
MYMIPTEKGLIFILAWWAAKGYMRSVGVIYREIQI